MMRLACLASVSALALAVAPAARAQYVGPAVVVPSIADLTSKPYEQQYGLAIVQGYYAGTNFGGGALSYQSASTAAVDGGTTFATYTGVGRWVRSGSALFAKSWGATGSDATTTGSCSGVNLTLAAAGDFANGEPISVVGCGASVTLTTPAAPTPYAEGATATLTGSISGTVLTASSVIGNIATGDVLTASGTSGLTIASQATGVPGGAGTYTLSAAPGSSISSEAMSVAGATSHAYQVVFYDAAGGYSAASTAATVANATASLFHANGSRNNQDVYVPFTLNGQSPAGVAFYRDGTCYTVQDPNGATFRRDFGQSGECPSWLPASAPTSPGADFLRTSIAAGAGTLNLTLASAATTSGTGLVEHDDTAALQAMASSQLGGRMDCGVYHTKGGLTLYNGSQQGLASAVGSCATLHPSGVFNVETTTGVGGGYNNQAFGPITIEADDMGGGYCLVANNANYPIYEVIMNHCYNETQLANVQRGRLYIESIQGRRGDFGFYASASTVQTQIDTLDVQDYNSASSNQGVAITLDGCTPNIKGRFRPQSNPAPVYMIVNKAACTVNGSLTLAGPQYMNLDGSATNGPWTPPLTPISITGSATANGMEQLALTSTATLVSGGRLCPIGTGTALDGVCYAFDVVSGTAVNLRNTTGGITVSTGSVTNPLAAITDLAGTTHHFSNFYLQVSSPNTTADGLYVGPNVRQVYLDGGQEFGGYIGITFRGLYLQMTGMRLFGNTYASWECVDGNEFKVVGGGSFNYINATAATSQVGGGVLDASCLNADVSGDWIGTQFDVHDQTPPSAGTRIADRPLGSPNDYSVSTAGSQTIDLAKYAHLYGAADPTIQVMNVWNYSSAVTDTFDDSAATIINSLRADQQRVGYTFDIRFNLHRTAGFTWAASGSGVTPSGTTTAPVPQSGGVSFLKIKGTVTGIGGSAAVSLFGCPTAAGSSPC